MYTQFGIAIGSYADGLVAGDHFGRHDAFFHRLVREQRRAGEVADRVDAVDRRLALRVDGDEAVLVELEAGASRLSPSVTGRRPTATSTMSNSRVSGLPFVYSPLNVALTFRSPVFSIVSTLVDSAISMPCFLRMRRSVFEISRSVPVRMLRQRLDDEHLRAEARVDGRELEADHAAADDRAGSSACA